MSSLTVHSTKEIIELMWSFHIEWYALEIPHRIDSFHSRCTCHIENDFIILRGVPATSNYERNFAPPFKWKIQKIQYMWKVHIISTFFLRVYRIPMESLDSRVWAHQSILGSFLVPTSWGSRTDVNDRMLTQSSNVIVLTLTEIRMTTRRKHVWTFMLYNSNDLQCMSYGIIILNLSYTLTK